MERETFLSKKVFFLNPHSVIQQELVRDLIANEYAVYLVTDHKRFRGVVRKFNEPIVFINIDEEIDTEGWEAYIRDLMDSEDNTASVGVLTYNEDKTLAQTYLMDLGIPCGFIKLKLGFEQSRQIILKTLEANEARGRRKYLRIDCWEKKNTELNLKINERLVSGRIRDISSVGMAFVLDEEQTIRQHMLLSDIQLKLKGKIARVSGPVMGTRQTPEGTIIVILFDKSVTPEVKSKIYSFIYETLQDEIQLMMTTG